MGNDVSVESMDNIIEDDMNANLHKTRGEYAVTESIRRYGFAEAGTLDKNNRIIGGNLRTAIAKKELDSDEAIIIDVDGKTPVYIRRTDVDLDTKEGRELAIALNRTGQLSVLFSGEVLDQLQAELDIEMDWLFTDEEWDDLERDNIDLDFDGLEGSNDGDSFDDEMTITVTMPSFMFHDIAAYLDRFSKRGVTYSRND